MVVPSCKKSFYNMVVCMREGERTTFQPDPDHNQDAVTGLLSPMLSPTATRNFITSRTSVLARSAKIKRGLFRSTGSLQSHQQSTKENALCFASFPLQLFTRVPHQIIQSWYTGR